MSQRSRDKTAKLSKWKNYPGFTFNIQIVSKKFNIRSNNTPIVIFYLSDVACRYWCADCVFTHILLTDGGSSSMSL